jgi:hypothetical protein
MYYDRRLPTDLLSLLAEGSPLSWMVGHVRSDWGQDNLAHLQFRRANGNRAKGGIQLYLGRTSPLEVVGKTTGHVELAADPFYRGITPSLFGRRIPILELPAVGADLDVHLREAARLTNPSFLGGEAVSHAGMMRRYGTGHGRGDPLLAVDSEIRVGFGSMAERTISEDDLRSRLRLLGKDDLPRKLDTLGILGDGNIGVVEVKDEHGDLVRAVVQVAAHMFTFTRLSAETGYDLGKVITGTADQKASVGLLPKNFGRLNGKPKIVPVIAAPESRATWVSDWLSETQAVRAAHAGLLDGLRFWKLSPQGEVLEEHVP